MPLCQHVISYLSMASAPAVDNRPSPAEKEQESECLDDDLEVEPQLKYRRLGNDVKLNLNKHAASCIAVNSKFLALGSHWGTISIIDHLGNYIQCAKLMSHTTTVNQISIDYNGDFIASCSDDGRVLINGLYTTDNNVNSTFDRPIKAIAIDPDYYKPGSGRRFITGDEKLILHEKLIMSRMKTTTLFEGEGFVRNIKWKGQFLACSTDLSVRVYEVTSFVVISRIERDQSPSLRPELYRCNLTWKDNQTLLIGWTDWIKIGIIKMAKPNSSSTAANETLPYYVEMREKPDFLFVNGSRFHATITPVIVKHFNGLACSFSTGFYIAGLAAYGNNLVVLSYLQDNEEEVPSRGNAKRPQLRHIEPQGDDYYELSTDYLSIKGFQEYRCNDYHLDSLPDEGLFVIVSPRDVVIVEPRDADDHITWLMEHQKFEEALTAVKQGQGKDLKVHNFLEVGTAYLNHLLDTGKFDKAGQFCVELLGKDTTLWEREVYKFAKFRQLKAVSPYIPRGDTRLSPAIYEMVLNEFLLTDYQGFRNLIKEWSSTLYKVPTLINAVIDRLMYDPRDPTLLQCLGDLYTYERQYDKSLGIYLKLGHKDVFNLITKHNLYTAMQEKLEVLMQLDTERAIEMFLDNLNKIPLETIIQRLKQSPQYLCQFLDKLFVKDSSLGEEYHGLQVKLYAEYQPNKLLSFLRNSNYYPLQEALEVCQLFHLTSEMVFLLGRMGNTKLALRLIVEELQDIDRAIEFCKEHDDKDLWEDLINYSLKKPAFINTMLNSIGTHVDPIIIIKRIQKGVEIQGLRDSLVKILQDYSLQISLREGCKKILVSDCYSLLDKLNKQQKRGVAVHDDQVCPACQCKILVGDVNQIGGVVVFCCRHAFHENCLPTPISLCVVCHTQKRTPGLGPQPRQ